MDFRGGPPEVALHSRLKISFMRTIPLGVGQYSIYNIVFTFTLIRFILSKDCYHVKICCQFFEKVDYI